MPEVTAIVTLCTHVEQARRAIDSVEKQTSRPKDILVWDDTGRCGVWVPYGRFGRGIDGTAFLSWLQAICSVKTDLVAILHDDDWWEPTWLERAVPMLTQDTAYVLCNGTIHFPDGSTRDNWPMKQTGHLDSKAFADSLLASTAVISPSSVLYRTADLRRNLLPFGPPLLPQNDVFCGPEHLAALLPLAVYPRVGYIAEPQVHLDGHAESITIREHAADGGQRIRVNYDSARAFFAIMSGRAQVKP